ncbi:MAG: thiamine phosphate synthase [Flavobacteriales bacterium]
MIDRLHYISSGKSPEEHLQHIHEACEAGVRWIQLRLKKITYDEYLFYACEARKITKTFDAILIINDNPRVAELCAADGVHVGIDDTLPEDIRKSMNRDIIIGGTANTWQDVLRLIEAEVDYIGLGPFRFTLSKEKLSPILGLKGYISILEKMKEVGEKMPVIAIGGIQLEDIAEITRTGVHGIAVSGLITNASDKSKCVEQIARQMDYKISQPLWNH